MERGGHGACVNAQSVSHMEAMFQKLWAMKRSQQMCDVHLILDDLSVHPCHGVLLAAASEPFCAILSHHQSKQSPSYAHTKEIHLERKAQIQTQIHETLSFKPMFLPLTGVTACALNLVLEHIYTGIELKLNAENVAEVLDFSILYDFTHIYEQCFDFLVSILCVENVCDILSFTDKYTYCSVNTVHLTFVTTLQTFLAQHIAYVTDTPSFTAALCANHLEKLLQNPLAGCSKRLYCAVVKWCEYNKEKRLHHLYGLLTSVCLPLLPIEFVRQSVQNSALVASCARCYALVQAALKLLGDRGVRGKRRLADMRRTLSRRGDGHRTVVLGLAEVAGEQEGGVHPEALVLQELCEGKGDQEVEVEEEEEECCACVYRWAPIGDAQGGVNTPLSPIQISKEKEKEKLARSFVDTLHGAACLGGCIFVLFSSSENAYSTTAWRRGDVNSEDLLQRREAVSQNHYHFHQYDVFTREWTALEVPQTLRFGCGMTALEGRVESSTGGRGEGGIFIIGGERLLPIEGDPDFNVLTSVERYNLSTQRWEMQASLPAPRKYPSAVTLQGAVYVFGGDDPGTDSVLRMGESGSWRQAGRLTWPRAQMVVAVLRGNEGKDEDVICKDMGSSCRYEWDVRSSDSCSDSGSDSGVYLSRGVLTTDGSESLQLEYYSALTEQVTIHTPLPYELFDFGLFVRPIRYSSQCLLTSTDHHNCNFHSLHTCGGYTDDSYPLRLDTDYRLSIPAHKSPCYDCLPPLPPSSGEVGGAKDERWSVSDVADVDPPQQKSGVSNILRWRSSQPASTMPLPMLNCSIHTL